VRDAITVGSTSAHALCRRFGLDPDELVGGTDDCTDPILSARIDLDDHHWIEVGRMDGRIAMDLVSTLPALGVHGARISREMADILGQYLRRIALSLEPTDAAAEPTAAPSAGPGESSWSGATEP